MRRAIAAAFIVGAVMTVGAGQEQPVLRIISPAGGSPIAGPVAIEAAVEPAGTPVQRMTFFVDGRRVCNVDHPPFQCAWDVGMSVREHALHVVALLADGRRVGQTIRTAVPTGFVDNADVNVVHVTVTALDGSTFATGLSREDFRVYEDDRERPVTYFSGRDIPLQLVAAIDVSDSMAASIGEMRENVKRFLSALPGPARVTLTAFNENFFVLSRPGAELAARLDSVDRLAAFGSTSLHDALQRSVGLLGVESGRHAVVMFTDGADTSSRVSREAIEQRVESSDAILYMIGHGDAVKVAALKNLCVRLAETSGGRAFFPKTMEEVGRAFADIVAELSHQYLIGYEPAPGKRDSAWHRIRVEERGGWYQLRYRKGYRLKTAG